MRRGHATADLPPGVPRVTGYHPMPPSIRDKDWACAICGKPYPVRNMARDCEKRHKELKS